MSPRYLLSIALAVATAVAACGEATPDTLSNGQGAQDETAGDDTGGKTGSKKKSGGGGATDPADPADPGAIDPNAPAGTTPAGPVPTNSPAGKEFFKANVHSFLASSCGGCHGAPNLAGPNWITTGDAEKSYLQLFQVGYVVQQSRIVLKPAHGGSTTNVLSTTQVGTYNQWVAMELKDGGVKAPPNVLAKLGDCFDRQKFDAMQLGQWRTTRRTNNNNTNNVTPWNENANNCTGCDNAPCTTCHSADAATNFNDAVGNPLLPADTTFNNTKLTNPAYITKYFGVSPEGKAIASESIAKKSAATMRDKAYTHPMFALTNNQQTALNAFVNDVITKYNAGTCGQAAPPAQPAQ